MAGIGLGFGSSGTEPMIEIEPIFASDPKVPSMLPEKFVDPPSMPPAIVALPSVPVKMISPRPVEVLPSSEPPMDQHC